MTRIHPGLSRLVLLLCTFVAAPAMAMETRFLPPTPEGRFEGETLTLFTDFGPQVLDTHGLVFAADFYSAGQIIWSGGGPWESHPLPIGLIGPLSTPVGLVKAEFYVDPGDYLVELASQGPFSSLPIPFPVGQGQTGLHLVLDINGLHADFFDLIHFTTAPGDPDVQSIFAGATVPYFENRFSDLFGNLTGVHGIRYTVVDYAYAPIPGAIWLLGPTLLGLWSTSRPRRPA